MAVFFASFGMYWLFLSLCSSSWGFVFCLFLCLFSFKILTRVLLAWITASFSMIIPWCLSLVSHCKLQKEFIWISVTSFWLLSNSCVMFIFMFLGRDYYGCGGVDCLPCSWSHWVSLGPFNIQVWVIEEKQKCGPRGMAREYQMLARGA